MEEFTMEEIISANRDNVEAQYNAAKTSNHDEYVNKNPKASKEYIYQNQKEDALFITNKFTQTNIRVISIVKRTKVGMDGLMIEIAKLMSTHPDDSKVILSKNIFFITGMSNKSWENDMTSKIPNCFKDNVFHHGKLKDVAKKIKGVKNCLIINDEIDTGDKNDQKLHKVLKSTGVLDISYMEENNIRFVFVSATMKNELDKLKKQNNWGGKHFNYRMTIPENYISHKDFLDRGIIKEFYPVTDRVSSDMWIKEDILDNYGDDYRVHIIRTSKEDSHFIEETCKEKNLECYNHTSDERITDDELRKIFDKIENHTIIMVKGFYRRANLIPDVWKKKIGAVHERHTKNVDTNVQIQGLPGRMTGYWKDYIDSGHKTGPYRTSIEAVHQYENFFNDPNSDLPYKTNGKKDIFLDPKHIGNSGYVEEEKEELYECDPNENIIEICQQNESLQNFWERIKRDYDLQKNFNPFREQNMKDGYAKCSVTGKSEIMTKEEVVSKIRGFSGKSGFDISSYMNKSFRKGKVIQRRVYVCYEKKDEINKHRPVVIIRILKAKKDITREL